MQVALKYVESSDEELIVACIGKEKQAWNELVERYKRLAFSVSLRSLPRDACDDVVQEVFKALYEVLCLKNPPEPPPNLEAWIRHVAHNKTIDAMRKPRPDALLDDAPAPDTREKLDDAIALWKAVESLPDKQRLIISAFLSEEQVTDEELAKRVKVKNAAGVRKIRERAMDKLKEILNPKENSERNYVDTGKNSMD